MHNPFQPPHTSVLPRWSRRRQVFAVFIAVAILGSVTWIQIRRFQVQQHRLMRQMERVRQREQTAQRAATTDSRTEPGTEANAQTPAADISPGTPEQQLLRLTER